CARTGLKDYDWYFDVW
nr:immunoglobulin heavy chain junction region [Mus musculus]